MFTKEMFTREPPWLSGRDRVMSRAVCDWLSWRR